MAKKDKDGEKKHRIFLFEIYPDGRNCPDDWHDRLWNSCLPIALSPLHRPEDKKPHYHGIFYTHSPLTDDGALTKFKDAGLIEEFKTRNGTKLDGVVANGDLLHSGELIPRCRYLCHMDDPQKEQFKGDPIDLIETMHGFPLTLTEPPSKEEKLHMRREVVGYIRELNITEYSTLLESLLDNEQFALFDYAATQTVMFNGYLTSRRHRAEDGEKRAAQAYQDDHASDDQGANDGE